MLKGAGDGRVHRSQDYNVQASLDPAIAAKLSKQEQDAQVGQAIAAAKQIGEIPVDQAHVGGMIAEGLK